MHNSMTRACIGTVSRFFARAAEGADSSIGFSNIYPLGVWLGCHGHNRELSGNAVAAARYGIDEIIELFRI
jgi:hypothetical protein